MASVLLAGIVLWSTLGGLLPAPAQTPSRDPNGEGFHSIFNGKDLTGWTVNAGGKLASWGADNGILFVQGGGAGWLMTEKEYKDFEIRLEYKMPKRGNSGVALRSPMKGDPAYVGMEIQLLDDANWKGLRPAQFTGSIYDVVPSSQHVSKPFGEWNKIHIVAKGRHVTVDHNGVRIVDANLDDHKDRVDKHPGLMRDQGHLGLQSHDGRVEFRNIEVKELKEAPAPQGGRGRVELPAGRAGRTADDPTRILDPGKLPGDSRLGPAKTLDSYFPFTPPGTKESWEARRRELREQVLIATGLWPMPARPPLKPVIHGSIDRDEYTIEKVFFASYPGHYVSGNLYRPKGKNGPLPGVLCPHGHWPNGRFYDAQAASGEQYVKNQIKIGAEKTIEGARFPLQARCAQLARMGCVVFHYDMVGNADSQQIAHRAGFTDAEAELRLQSFMGLQTFNSIRALDFLLSLPEVDPKRIGVTGASGGGTQTFILCAIDDRPTVAFPAVMVSTAMQGGCICENCSYLRQNTGNVEIAGLFAPKPLGMSGANDWTKEIESKGLPELKALYRLYDAEDKVMARAFPQFEHNYNQVSREVMYGWFNKYLRLGQPEPVAEKPFVPVPPKELSVYDAAHPRPPDATDAAGLRRYLTTAADEQLAALRPKDATSLTRFRDVVGRALTTMVGSKPPAHQEIERSFTRRMEFVEGDNPPSGAAIVQPGPSWRMELIGPEGRGEKVPIAFVRGAEFDGTILVWVHPTGKASLVRDGALTPVAKRILSKHAGILAPDVFLTGECSEAPSPAVNSKYAGFTFGYNHPVLANRVHDVLTTLAYAKRMDGAQTIHLVGWGEAGPWVLLARALAGSAVDRTAADMNHFRFETVTKTDDPMMLPGALKYGGLPAFTALCAPGELWLQNASGTEAETWAKPAYDAASASERLRISTEKIAAEETVDWLVR